MLSDDHAGLSGMPCNPGKYNNPYEKGRIGIIEQLIPAGKGGSALDIGCGTGIFSRELTIKGWLATAVDADSKSLNEARKYGVKTIMGKASEVLSGMSGESYDFILALEIIEHMSVDQAKVLLSEIARVAKPGAKLILSTPNRLSLEGLGYYYWGEKFRGWRKWDAWDATHVYIYSSLEIIKLLKRRGFRINSITGYHYEGRLPIIGRIRMPFKKSRYFPLNMLGFNIILECHRIEK